MKSIDINEKITRSRARIATICLEREGTIQRQIKDAKDALLSADEKNKLAIGSTISTLEERMKAIQDQNANRKNRIKKAEKDRANLILSGAQKAFSLTEEAKKAQERINTMKSAQNAKEDALKKKAEAFQMASAARKGLAGQQIDSDLVD